jgi:hypothetical protein
MREKADHFILKPEEHPLTPATGMDRHLREKPSDLESAIVALPAVLYTERADPVILGCHPIKVLAFLVCRPDYLDGVIKNGVVKDLSDLLYPATDSDLAFPVVLVLGREMMDLSPIN